VYKITDKINMTAVYSKIMVLLFKDLNCLLKRVYITSKPVYRICGYCRVNDFYNVYNSNTNL